MNSVHIAKQKGKRKVIKPVRPAEIQQNIVEAADGGMIDSQHTLISMLLPPAVKAFLTDLESEVEALCGKRYTRATSTRRFSGRVFATLVNAITRRASRRSRRASV